MACLSAHRISLLKTNYSLMICRHQGMVNFHRVPLKVLTDDGKDYYDQLAPQVSPYKNKEFEADEELLPQSSGNARKKRNTYKKKGNSQSAQKLAIKDSKSSHGKYDFIKTMLSVTNPDNRSRTNEKLVILEGERLITDAFESGAKLTNIFYTAREKLASFANLDNIIEKTGANLTKVDDKEFKMFSKVVTSPGFLGTCVKPKIEDIYKSESYQNADKMPTTLIMDNIRDPGNMGTLIRTAAAAGVEKIVCTRGCVDVWEAKVLRAGSGAHFRIPIQSEVSWAYLESLLTKNGEKSATLYYAEQEDKAQPQESNENSQSDGASYDTTRFFSSGGNEHVALMIGGEARGLSDEARQLITKLQARKLWIPLSYGVESLNSSVAGSIILYAIRKQFNETSQIINL